jgi:CDP-2,3-bis-(O-geranylgeranyl)-sn-glycerol synthase
MVSIIIKSLYFFLPAYFANMAPVLFKKLPFLDISISEKLFGKNKTWRGIFVAVVVGYLTFVLQKIAYSEGFTSWALIDYSDFTVLFGAALGLGAIVGDLVKSYYKRKAGIAPGTPWWGFDQLDFVFGGIAASFIFYVPRVEVVTILIVFSPVLHMLVNRIGYFLKIRKAKY